MSITPRIFIIRNILALEEKLPIWECMPDILEMSRDELETYLDYLKEDNFYQLQTA